MANSTARKMIQTKTGLSIDPIGSVQELLSGTSFIQDEVAQSHLEALGLAFQEIGKTEEGMCPVSCVLCHYTKLH